MIRCATINNCWSQGILTEGEGSSTLDLLELTRSDQPLFMLKFYIFFIYKTTNLNEEVDCTVPSPSVRVPWVQHSEQPSRGSVTSYSFLISECPSQNIFGKYLRLKIRDKTSQDRMRYGDKIFVTKGVFGEGGNQIWKVVPALSRNGGEVTKKLIFKSYNLSLRLGVPFLKMIVRSSQESLRICLNVMP